MRHLLVTASVAALLTVTTEAGAQDFETTEVADGVYQFRWIGHNAMIVVADGQVVVFDPISVEASEAMAGEIRRVAQGASLSAVVYSHSDADHSTGAAALASAMGAEGVPIIAQEGAVAPIRERGSADQPVPNVTFAERLAFEIGGRDIELHYLGRSHTDNIAVAFVPDGGVAFAVDFIANDRAGYQDLPGWHFPEFFDAVAGMLGIPFETVIFGHGPPGDRASIHRQIAYYDDLTAAVRDAIAAGRTEDQMAAEISLPAYEHFDRYEEWMPLNARGIYRWLTGAP
jgi:glyoxylase-like metal-dependent hydrolase (beta-lactamase superfamily II)